MPFTNLSEALNYCPANIGMGPSVLKSCIIEFLSDNSDPISLTLDNGDTMRLISHNNNGRTIITSLDSLSSSCKEGISLNSLPEILNKLNQQGLSCDAIQFPHAFMVKGRLSGTTYRAHFNHLLILKDSTGQLNANIIDSTLNPIGIYNPVPVLNWLTSNSIVSGEELLQVKFRRLLSGADTLNSVQSLFKLTEQDKINFASPIFTSKQSSVGDKRCGIYMLSAADALIKYITSDEVISTTAMSALVIAAHQELNEPEMMQLSFPSPSKNSVGQ